MKLNASTDTERSRFGILPVIATCLVIATLEGLDMIMFSAVLPTLLEEGEWGITAATAGLIGSLSLLGMLVGAIVAGYVTDTVGRRPVILACVVLFSLFTTLGGLASSATLFGVFRFLAGVGFGGALPTVIALTMEYVRKDRRQFYNGVVQTGFTLGGCLIALAAMVVIPSYGWRPLFLIGGGLGLVVLAIAAKTLPESIAFLARTGRVEEVSRIQMRYGVEVEENPPAKNSGGGSGDRSQALRLMFGPQYRVASLLFPLICFCGLLVAYAMGTWIPQILRASGYDLGSALTFLIGFNLGNAMGMVVISGLADRFGSRPVISLGFVAGAAAVVLLTLEPAQAIVFVLVLLIGFFSSSQTAVSGFVGVYYPDRARGTALGLSLGLGRLGGICGPILTGLIVGSSLGVEWAYYIFAVVGVLTAGLVLLVPRINRSTNDEEYGPTGERPTASAEV
ncbi:MFS transporter [Rhodococcus aetherivorans]